MDRIAEFVDSFIPKNLPKKRIASLKDELTCHILDKRDYYIMLGYDKNTSTDKAISDFGTDKESKNYIYGEFEELYSEKTVYAVASFVIISVMNFLCFYLDCWIWSADCNGEPGFTEAMISFMMIFTVLVLISFARVEKCRKTLISIGVANTAIACSLLFAFYPQMAAYTMVQNVVYLIDRFTPISVGTAILEDYYEMAAIIWSFLILLIPAVYCFIEAFRIKRGSANNVSNSRKKLAIAGVSFLAVSVVSSLMLTTAKNYVDNYPKWINRYQSYISAETEQKFNEIALGDSYNEVCAHLKSYGYISIDSYKERLDKLTKKQFENEMKLFSFADGYEIWFSPDEYIEGNGLIGLKQENGIVTAKGTGNMSRNMYGEKYCDFGAFSDENCNMSAVLGYFESLHKGDSEIKIMSRFGGVYGEVYTKRIEYLNGEKVSYYRVTCFEDAHYEDDYRIDMEERYFEFTFKDGKLSDGIMYHAVDYPTDNPVETLVVS